MSNTRQVNIATSKITKGQIDEALAAGVTHAKFHNKGVQKRLKKNQEKVRREQERRNNHYHLVNKRNAEALAARQAAQAKLIEAGARGEQQTAEEAPVGAEHMSTERGTFSGAMQIVEESPAVLGEIHLSANGVTILEDADIVPAAKTIAPPSDMNAMNPMDQMYGGSAFKA
ncbi:hypothetical protein [Ralstonia phage RP12]|uniref:Uncharacterized protein n=1 Tax=Ralstonia phage RP12 TaxID=1923889 RepID=A0A1L7N0J9_9CAUD|nr:hypothetical protein FDH28_gp015 [Ralstonia phage RP12]BAW18989.1 hypothetical protein [Ralstonia phage RP12]